MSFSLDGQQTREDEGNGSILLEVSYAQDADVSVSYTVEASNAVEGVDFTINSPNPVVIPAGEFSTTIDYTITDNNAFEPLPRSFTVTMTEATGDVGINGNKAATVTLVNDDCPVNTLVWTEAAAPTQEDVGFAEEPVGLTPTADAECDVIFVDNALGVGAGVSQIARIEFTPSAPGATSGTVFVPETQFLYPGFAYSQPTGRPTIQSDGTGTYDEATGIIEFDYIMTRQNGDVWFTGTLIIRANN